MFPRALASILLLAASAAFAATPKAPAPKTPAPEAPAPEAPAGDAAPEIPAEALLACQSLHPGQCEAFDALTRRGDEATPVAIAMLSHDAPRIRRAGARLLARNPAREAAPVLVRLLDDADPDVRADALDALGMAGDAAHVRAVVAILGQEKERAPRVAALRALGRLGGGEGVIPLLEAVEAGEPWAVGTAVRSLGAVGDPRAVIPVAALLVDPRVSGETQAEAARALARLKDPRAIPNLMLATASRDVEVRRQAIRTLGILQARQAVDLLIELLSDDTVLRETVQALGNIDDPATLEPLLTVMRIEELPVDIRAAVVQALGRRKVEDAVPELMAMLRDADGRLAVEVLRALGAIGDERAIARLIETLESKDPTVVGAANSALQRITGQTIDPNPAYWNKWLAERESEESAVP